MSETKTSSKQNKTIKKAEAKAKKEAVKSQKKSDGKKTAKTFSNSNTKTPVEKKSAVNSAKTESKSEKLNKTEKIEKLEKVSKPEVSEKTASVRTSRKSSSKISYQKDFYSDLQIANMLNAKVVRCPAPKGIIKSVSLPDIPEEYFLVTARDIPGSNLIDTVCGKVPVFCNGNISYLGEPIGLLVGPDQEILDKLMSELVIEIDENSIEDYLDNIVDENKKEEKKSSKVKKSKVAGKKSKLFQIQDVGSEFFTREIASRQILWPENSDIDSVFENAAHVIEEDYSYSLNIPNYGEPNGALCFWKDDALTVYTPTQWISDLRYMLSSSLKIESESINIRRTQVYNHGSNSIWYNSVIACQVAAASLKAQKPVKLIYSRQEQNVFLDDVRPVNISHKTAADENGRITAMEITIDVDAGFLNPFAQEIIDRLVIAATGSVKPENLKINARIYTSNYPASSIDLQLVDSAAFFAVENQLNLLADECNLTPCEIREINGYPVICPDLRKAKKDNYPFCIELNRYQDALKGALKIANFDRKYASYHLDAQGRKFSVIERDYDAIRSAPLRGIGFATGWSGSAYFGSKLNEYDQAIELSLDAENNVTIHCPPISHSIQDIWTELISNELNIKESQVKINTEFEPGEEPLLPENIYSNISVMTVLLKKCLDQLKKNMDKSSRPFSVKRKLSPAQKNEWDKEKFTGKPFHSTAFGVAVLELELDACSYREKIRSITLVLNAGKVFNIKAAENAVRLSVQKVMESLLVDDVVNFPKTNINFLASEEDPMQIGDLIYQIIPAAYTQALTQILNCSINTLPLHSDTVFNLLSEQQLEEIQKESELEMQAEENTESETTEQDKDNRSLKQKKQEQELNHK